MLGMEDRSAELEQVLVERVANESMALETTDDLDALMDHIGEARFVLIGEASHGTSDFYVWRALLTQRLIQEKGFAFVAVEGDWPDCYAINRYVKNYPGTPRNAQETLETFRRWPTWMWANWEVDAFAEWLRRYNENQAEQPVGFYGLDVYSLWESMELAINYLKANVPEAVETAYQAFRCFQPFGEDPQAYARQVAFVPETCEGEVIELLHELRRSARRYDGDREAVFDAEQNAHVLLNAERYYRAMMQGGASSWNIRDLHMADTLDRLARFHGEGAKAVVWAHNTHVGDARATDMVEVGMFNLGQLVRERWQDQGVALVGMGAYQGSVIAARTWGGELEAMKMPPPSPGSWEDILHRAGGVNRLVLLREDAEDVEFMHPRALRAIGVVYAPEQERYSNYVPSVLPGRFDAYVYLDDTKPLAPMGMAGEQHPALYPWSF